MSACMVCGDRATEYRTYEPWPGSSYAHTSWACKAHATYVDGHCWGRGPGTEWEDGGIPRTSCLCGREYGACGCSNEPLARRSQAWMARSIRGSLR